MAKDNVDECWVGSALRTNGNGVVAEQPLDADSRTRQERRGQGVVSERQSRGSSGLPAILAAGATPGRRQSRRTGSATSAPGAVQRDWVGLVGPPNLRVRHQYPKRTRSQYVDPSSSGWLGFQTAATNGQVTQPTATPIATPIRARFIGRSVCAEGRDHPRMAAWASATFTAAPRARSGGPSPPYRPAAARRLADQPTELDRGWWPLAQPSVRLRGHERLPASRCAQHVDHVAVITLVLQQHGCRRARATAAWIDCRMAKKCSSRGSSS